MQNQSSLTLRHDLECSSESSVIAILCLVFTRTQTTCRISFWLLVLAKERKGKSQQGPPQGKKQSFLNVNNFRHLLLLLHHFSIYHKGCTCNGDEEDLSSIKYGDPKQRRRRRRRYEITKYQTQKRLSQAYVSQIERILNATTTNFDKFTQLHCRV